MLLDLENKNWLKEFNLAHGRAPRVLHIGNIANNAFNNAKILNEIGLDNDVISYNYYHMMACPEWEEANFDWSSKNDFYPNWSSLNLNGYKRPDWFIQGPLTLCLDYLIDRQNKGLFLELGKINRTIKTYFSINLYLELMRQHQLVNKISFFSTLNNQSAFYSLYKKLTPKFGKLGSGLCSSAIMFTLPFFILLRQTHKIRSSILKISRRNNRVNNQSNLTNSHIEDGTFSKLFKRWQTAFPERVDQLVESDLIPYLEHKDKWAKVLSQYDFIIGYSTDPFIPLLSDKPYFAFEHGTIRDIPFDNDDRGRRTALAYHEATHVFVTNHDCIPSANKLAPGRYTVLNHPYDEDFGLDIQGFKEIRAKLLKELDSDFLFFFPTRHDWVENTGYADKANDVFLMALSELRKHGIKVGAVCCEWGANVRQSKELLARENLTNHVAWYNPMPIVKFILMARACDMVVDQFKLGAFGGVLFKAMAAGVPILTYLNESIFLRHYTEIPPVVNCKTSDEIVSECLDLCKNKNKINELGKLSREWIKKYHGKATTINLQLNQFRMAYYKRE